LGGGSPEGARVILMRNYDIDARKKMARIVAGIENGRE